MQLPFRPIPIVLVAGLSGLIGGASGVLLLVFMLLLTQMSLGREQADKHGISERNASRMGGVAIILGTGLFCGAAVLNLGPDVGAAGVGLLRGYEWAALLIGLVGLIDDLTQRISPAKRLVLMTVIVAGVFSLQPRLLPGPIDFWVLNDLLNQPAAIAMGATLIVVGFVNAGNIADGANGLLATMALCVFFLAYQHTQTVLFFGLFVSVAVFALYNLVSGQLFLGDFGSYGLSAMMALACLDMLQSSDASIWFFAAVLSYPCTELVRVMVNRLLRKRSPFAADNSHVHNKVFAALKRAGCSALLANSLTGLIVSGLFSVLPTYLALSGVLSWTSPWWFVYFLAGVALHLILSLLSRQKLRSRYSDVG